MKFALPAPLKLTALVNAISAFQIPLLAFITPRVIACDERRTEVRVRLDRRTRNHLGVMYFGSLAMGAELSIMLKAIEAVRASGKPIQFIFKDFESQFLKRADGHVHFICEEADAVQTLVGLAAGTTERVERQFKGFATVPSRSNEPVMTYKLTLSLRQKV